MYSLEREVAERLDAAEKEIVDAMSTRRHLLEILENTFLEWAQLKRVEALIQEKRDSANGYAALTMCLANLVERAKAEET